MNGRHIRNWGGNAGGPRDLIRVVDNITYTLPDGWLCVESQDNDDDGSRHSSLDEGSAPNDWLADFGLPNWWWWYPLRVGPMLILDSVLLIGVVVSIISTIDDLLWLWFTISDDVIGNNYIQNVVK